MPNSRRQFLQSSAVLLAAPFILPSRVWSQTTAPGKRLTLGCIGMGKQMGGHLGSFINRDDVEVLAVCDVDTTRRLHAQKRVDDAYTKKAGQTYRACDAYNDFREVLARKDIDAVVIATPDHWHAYIAIAAVRAGKDVYCEKPLAHTVWECRQLRLWAEKTGVVTQMGNQIHSSVEYRLATRLIRDGVIGKVKEVHSWLAFTGNERTRLLEPPASGPVPKGVDWDLWLGGAPHRPFAPRVYHPFAWRDWQDFGSGALGDFGAHIFDPVFTALGLTAPLTVSADHSGINRHIWPTLETVRYVFPGTAFTAGPTLPLTWSDGGLRPSRQLAQLPPELDLPQHGSLFIGEKGNLVLPHVGGPRLYPVENFTGFVYPKDIKGLNHHHAWVDAILTGGRTSAGFHYAGPLSETVQLGNVATRVALPPSPTRGSQVATRAPALAWDAAALRITNHPAAQALLTKTYRPGWEVPAA